MDKFNTKEEVTQFLMARYGLADFEQRGLWVQQQGHEWA